LNKIQERKLLLLVMIIFDFIGKKVCVYFQYKVKLIQNCMCRVYRKKMFTYTENALFYYSFNDINVEYFSNDMNIVFA
jgi:hypothetical protein